MADLIAALELPRRLTGYGLTEEDLEAAARPVASPEFPLASTNGGRSTYILHGQTLEFLESHAYAINIHKSTSDLATYVSCGNIKP